MDSQALAMTLTVGDDNYHLQKLHILRNGYESEAKAWDTPRLGVKWSGLSRNRVYLRAFYSRSLFWDRLELAVWISVGDVDARK